MAKTYYQPLFLLLPYQESTFHAFHVFHAARYHNYKSRCGMEIGLLLILHNVPGFFANTITEHCLIQKDPAPETYQVQLQ